MQVSNCIQVKGLSENSSKSIAIKGDTSLVKSIDVEGQELGYNTQIGLMSSKLVAEGSNSVEFSNDATWNQLILNWCIFTKQ